MTNYKIHFGKNISFKSNLIELLTSEKINNNLIYVKDNHLSLLAPGLHNQYLSYDNGRYTWKFMEGDFDQGVWPLSLYSTDFFTPDGYGSPIDINPEKEYTYPQYMSMPYINEEIIEVSGYMAKQNNEYKFLSHPAFDGLAEYGGTFYYEIYNADKLNISANSDVNIINNEIIESSGEYTEIVGDLSNKLFEDDVTLLVSPELLKMNKIKNTNEYVRGNYILTTTAEYIDNYAWNSAPYNIFNSYCENTIKTGWCVQLTDDITLPQSITLTNNDNSENLFKFNNYSFIFGYSSTYDYSSWIEEEKPVSYRI
jgi:hypothetical protein